MLSQLLKSKLNNTFDKETYIYPQNGPNFKKIIFQDPVNAVPKVNSRKSKQ